MPPRTEAGHHTGEEREKDRCAPGAVQDRNRLNDKLLEENGLGVGLATLHDLLVVVHISTHSQTKELTLIDPIETEGDD